MQQAQVGFAGRRRCCLRAAAARRRAERATGAQSRIDHLVKKLVHVEKLDAPTTAAPLSATVTAKATTSAAAPPVNSVRARANTLDDALQVR